jgi:hypothetical protein
MTSNQKGDSTNEEPVVVIRRELRNILKSTTVNPEPIPYWGPVEDDEGNRPPLSSMFCGRTILRTFSKTSTRATFQCDYHSAIVANPDAFSLAVDDDGCTGVHACAINGYLNTLKVLVEEGAASPYAKVSGQVDALVLARRRGHKAVLEYLISYADQEGRARFVEIQARVAERRARKAAVAALLERDEGLNDDDDDASTSQPSVTTAVLAEQRTAKQAEARTQALKASMAAIQQDTVKPVELLPRKFWRAEYAQLDDARGVGYYPRKPLAEEE